MHNTIYLFKTEPVVQLNISRRNVPSVSVAPLVSVQNQLVGARLGQRLTLECSSEAFPKSINYWTRDQDRIVPQGEYFSDKTINTKSLSAPRERTRRRIRRDSCTRCDTSAIKRQKHTARFTARCYRRTVRVRSSFTTWESHERVMTR